MLVNLIKNSVEAIDELAASMGLSGLPFIKVRCYVKLNSFILEVVDSGIGIEKDKFTVIFEGDYTTKESGSGLGLHSIANFVDGLNGKIYPLSDGISRGTTIRVILPLSSVTP
jgi:two-component system phosphate regulon sensor histidine kinase PhoR